MPTRAVTNPSAAPADVSVRLAIALAFADASVAVLALPQIVQRLHTSISHVTWVITAYNLALIATTVVMVPFARRLASVRALVAGLGIFGLASLGAGLANSLTVLIVWRCIQGAGGGLLLCASLPLFAREHRGSGSTLQSWAATAAIGAAVGPAAGGILTQVFDWRAIFLAQAPVAALAAVTALRGGEPSAHADGDLGETASAERGATKPRERDGGLSPLLANIALAFVSAGLIGALFLSTVLLINVWELSPLGAAAVLAVIPLATACAERLIGRRSAIGPGAAGAVVLAAGLVLLALIPQRELGLTVVALALSGAGLGLAFPALTRVALQSHGPLFARAARTVAAREGGLVLGLVLLTPVLVNELESAPHHAIPQVTKAIVSSPIGLLTKLELGARLAIADAAAPQSQLPDFGPAFAHAAAGESAQTRAQLLELESQVDTLVQRAVTHSFRKPLLLCALLSLLALVPLGYARLRRARE